MDSITSSGIYEIVNAVNGYRYIGSAINIRNRWYQHTSRLNKNQHENQHLQRAWNKYGASCFEFKVIETCFAFMLLSREQHYLDLLSPEYNVRNIAESNFGVRLSDETKKKISLAHLGMKPTPMSESARMKMSEERRGVPKSEQTKANMSKAQKGRKMTDEHRKNLSLARMGIKHSEEAKAKISAGHSGKQKSEETKKNMSIAQRLWRLKKKLTGQEARK